MNSVSGEVIKAPLEISKELEKISFSSLQSVKSHLKHKIGNKNTNVTGIAKVKFRRWVFKKNKISAETRKRTRNNEPKNQLETFQKAMKPLLIIGQCVGLNPVQNILAKDVSKMRFRICYWRFLQCMLLGIAQTVAVVLCLYRLLHETITISALAYISFYANTCLSTFLFIQIGMKWPKLMKTISKCGLDEYVDPNIKFKCYAATVVIISSGILEHCLSLLANIVETVYCYPNINYYEKFMRDQFPWIFDLNVPRYVPLGIFLQIVNVVFTLNWNYSDLYIVCMSMYLASIFERINKKISTASEKHYLPSCYWRGLREDYTRATKLVSSFDDVISGVVFISFASNLFFICLQLFNVLAHGILSKQKQLKICPNLENGPLGGYENTVYLLFSVIYLFARSLFVSLVAASVNTASLVPASFLYSVPSTAFCEEVSRFISQVNGDNIALTGLQFFYVSRDLLLSVAGTIVTYELVLLQLSGSEIGS